MKNYEGITLLIYRSWGFRGVEVPGPRERLGFFLSLPDIFPNVASSRGEGSKNTSLGGVGENKDIKHVKMLIKPYKIQHCAYFSKRFYFLSITL